MTYANCAHPIVISLLRMRREIWLCDPLATSPKLEKVPHPVPKGADKLIYCHEHIDSSPERPPNHLFICQPHQHVLLLLLLISGFPG